MTAATRDSGGSVESGGRSAYDNHFFMVPIIPGWFLIVWHGLPFAFALAADMDDPEAAGPRFLLELSTTCPFGWDSHG